MATVVSEGVILTVSLGELQSGESHSLQLVYVVGQWHFSSHGTIAGAITSSLQSSTSSSSDLVPGKLTFLAMRNSVDLQIFASIGICIGMTLCVLPGG